MAEKHFCFITVVPGLLEINRAAGVERGGPAVREEGVREGEGVEGGEWTCRANSRVYQSVEAEW